MAENKHLADQRARRPGSFVDITDTLLPLFVDPDGRSGKCWEDLFGEGKPDLPRRGGIRFNVSVRRRSSSDC